MPAPASAVEGSGAKRPAANGGPVKLLQERGQTFRDGLLNVIELDPEHSLPAIRKETSAAPSSLRKKVFEVSGSATMIQDPSARRTKDSQPSGFGSEYYASPVRFRVFQQTARRCRIGALRLSPEVRIWPLSRRLVLVESPPCSAVRFRSC